MRSTNLAVKSEGNQRRRNAARLLQLDDGCAPRAARFIAEAIGCDKGRALQQGVHGRAQRSGAFAMDDAHIAQPALGALGQVSGNQLAEITRAKGVKIELTRNWQCNGPIFGIVSRHGNHPASPDDGDRSEPEAALPVTRKDWAPSASLRSVRPPRVPVPPAA